MIKLIATDLDGTLATHKGHIPEETFDIVRELHAMGITFVVATGRQTASVENDFREVVEDIYVIAENGGVVRHAGEDCYITTIAHEKALAVIAELEKIPDIHFMVCCKDYAYQNRQDAYFDRELDKYYHNRRYKEDLKTVDEPIIKIAIYHPEDITKEIEVMVRQRWEKDFKITVSGIHWVDIGSLDINKGKALACIQNDLGITPHECVAFGDYFNDVDMLMQVEHSYVMSHALPEVKAYGKHEVETGKVLDVIKKIMKRQK